MGDQLFEMLRSLSGKTTGRLFTTITLVTLCVIVACRRSPLETLQCNLRRPSNSRINGLPYAPFLPVLDVDGRIADAAVELATLARETPSVANVRSYAVADIAMGRASEAVALLSKAA